MYVSRPTALHKPAAPPSPRPYTQKCMGFASSAACRPLPQPRARRRRPPPPPPRAYLCSLGFCEAAELQRLRAWSLRQPSRAWHRCAAQSYMLANTNCVSLNCVSAQTAWVLRETAELLRHRQPSRALQEATGSTCSHLRQVWLAQRLISFDIRPVLAGLNFLPKHAFDTMRTMQPACSPHGVGGPEYPQVPTLVIPNLSHRRTMRQSLAADSAMAHSTRCVSSDCCGHSRRGCAPARMARMQAANSCHMSTSCCRSVGTCSTLVAIDWLAMHTP